MDRLTEYYSVTLKNFISNYKVREGYYEIPMSIFVGRECATATQAKYQIDNLLRKVIEEKIDINARFNYNYSKIIIKENFIMRKNFYVEIPYMERERYIRFIYEANEIISDNGCIIIAVKNIPNHGECAIILESINGEEFKIKDLINKYNLTIRYDRGMREIVGELGDKLWDISSMPIGLNYKGLEDHFMSLFTFASNKMLKSKGYNINTERKRKQIFISYSHKNKDIVRAFTEELHECGINAFIDYKAIDYGENILDAIMYGIEESALNIIFLSNDYKESMYAKTELLTIWDRFIRETSSWIIVKLDDINPNDIKPGLGGYKYFEWDNNSDELIEVIKNRVKKL